MPTRTFKVICVACVCLTSTLGIAAEPQQVSVGPIDKMANDVFAVYREGDRSLYLDNVLQLQLAAGGYEAAIRTIAARRVLDVGDTSLVAKARHIQYAILAQAKVRQAATKASFESAFEQAFRETFARLDDRTSAHAIRLFVAMDAAAVQRNLTAQREQSKGKSSCRCRRHSS